MKTITLNGLQMSFTTLSKIWNKCQKAKALQGITSKERAKQSLTQKELLLKYAQMGGILTCGVNTFTFENGLGVLTTATSKTMGASFNDFLKLAE